MRNVTCTKIFTKTSLQTNLDLYMRVHVNLMVKLFKTNWQKYPSRLNLVPVSPISSNLSLPLSPVRPPNFWMDPVENPRSAALGFESSGQNPLSVDVGLRDSAGSGEIRPKLKDSALSHTQPALFPCRLLWEIRPNPMLGRISYLAGSWGMLAAGDQGRGFFDVAGGPAVWRAGLFRRCERDLDQHFSWV